MKGRRWCLLRTRLRACSPIGLVQTTNSNEAAMRKGVGEGRTKEAEGTRGLYEKFSWSSVSDNQKVSRKEGVRKKRAHYSGGKGIDVPLE